MAGSVFVVGSLHLDVVVDAPKLPAIDETVTGSGVDFVCGGKGANQAVAAALHGATTHMAGRVGDDLFAARLLAHLDAAGVEHSRIQVGRGSSSGMSVAIVLDHGDYGAVIVSAANLDLDADAIVCPEDTAVVVLQNEILEPVNSAMACQAQARGARVILNAAPWRHMSEALLERVDLLVLNRVEAAAMTGADLASLSASQHAATALVTPRRAVIVTLGADGVVYCDSSGDVYTQPAFDVDVVSTHGAGDLFVGSLASRLAAGDAMHPALRYAAAAAAAHVATPVPNRLAIGPHQVAQLLAVTPP